MLGQALISILHVVLHTQAENHQFNEATKATGGIDFLFIVETISLENLRRPDSTLSLGFVDALDKVM